MKYTPQQSGLQGSGEGRGQVGDEIVRVFDADGEADVAGIDGQGRTGGRGVGHRGRDLDQGLDAAKGDGMGEEPGAGDEIVRGRFTSVQHETNHTAGASICLRASACCGWLSSPG